MKKQQPKHKALFNLIYLVLFLFILSWIVFWGSNSFYQKWRLQQSASKKEKLVEALEAQNDSLKQENQRLKTDPEERKRAIRAAQGIYAEDETAYIFKPAQGDSMARPGKKAGDK
ncbi:MAG: septum formation initiator family protein [Candidatus Cloacimonetes bacterium]|jgi:cell division protein FtsB|nr:septum formation initiator family protein [Candidatus Cloacimonadota bacterium]MDY0366394.1 septum formation initiator family protein [Candidatus Syntrophosphaera sp.]